MCRAQAVQRIIGPAVEVLGFELVSCELHRHGSVNVLRIMIDSSAGVSLDDCAKISRQVSAVLDVEDPINGRYNLEVSSPGLERPLFSIDHYRRFIGRPVKIRLRLPRVGQRQFRGVIASVDKEITLKIDDSRLKVALSEIEKANLIASEFRGPKK